MDQPSPTSPPPPSSNGIISSSRLSFVRAHVHSPVSRESRSTDNGGGGVGWPGHWARVTLHCPKAKKRRGAIAQLLLLSLAATKWPSRTTTRRRLIEGRRHGLAARIRGRASTRRTMAQNKSNRFFFFFIIISQPPRARLRNAQSPFRERSSLRLFAFLSVSIHPAYYHFIYHRICISRKFLSFFFFLLLYQNNSWPSLVDAAAAAAAVDDDDDAPGGHGG